MIYYSCILYDVFVLVGLISVLRDALNNVDSLLIVFELYFQDTTAVFFLQFRFTKWTT